MSALPTARAALTLLTTVGWWYVDFEAFPATKRPDPLQDPVGVAIKRAGCRARYYAFAHPAGDNNCTYAEAKAALKAVWDSGTPICFHNAKFDLAMAYSMGLRRLARERIHDTMLMLFLADPRAKTFALKPNAERLCGDAPEERDAVIEWLVKHQPVPGVHLVPTKPTDKKSKSKYAGAYVAYAPVKLVGPYACGDVVRTEKLARVLVQELSKRKMLDAYDVERFVLGPIMAMEAWGVPVDLPRLRADVVKYRAALAKVETWLEVQTGCPTLLPNGKCRWDSSAALLKALKGAGFVDGAKLKKTKTGKEASNKDSLAGAVTHPQALTALKYRSRVVNSLRTFMEPWLVQAEKSGGLIFTVWNTTRTDDSGARTGRLSSTPNFQNLTKRNPYLFGTSAEGAGKAIPKWWKKMDLPDLPNVRGYVVAPLGHILVDRDYSQQELRIYTHYAEGELLAKYLEDWWFDVHGLVNARVNELMGAEVSRDVVKRIVFAVVYGMGKPGVVRLSSEYGIPGPTLIKIAEAVKKAVPGLVELNKDLRKRCDQGLPIRTWGGREYYCEEPRMVKGDDGYMRMRSFEYKMLNLLIQGGAADNTKRALLNLWRMMKRHPTWRILLLVHDEFVLSVPVADMSEAHRVLCKAMSDVKFDLPMLSEGKSGYNWGDLVAYDKKGKDVYTDELKKWREKRAAAKLATPVKRRKAA